MNAFQVPLTQSFPKIHIIITKNITHTVFLFSISSSLLLSHFFLKKNSIFIYLLIKDFLLNIIFNLYRFLKKNSQLFLYCLNYSKVFLMNSNFQKKIHLSFIYIYKYVMAASTMSTIN